MCIFLNKFASTLLWLALEFFPARSQGPSLGGPSQEFARDLGLDCSLVPPSPATAVPAPGTQNRLDVALHPIPGYSGGTQGLNTQGLPGGSYPL